MNQSDAYYRALLTYCTLIGSKRECVRDRRAFVSAGGEESIRLTRAHCTVDESWIVEIEKGLVHIEKAIKEERQFIYSNGEVIPIEKVKNVSKDSVQHLARHSDLITRLPEEESDLVPDKLYTVERYSDYTVYENRFLYMLLCYLRDFVTLRYQKILDLTNRYDGKLSVKKDIVIFNRTLDLCIDMHDVRKDDPYLREHNPAKALIDRMDLILKTIMSYLSTPLMESVEKAPMLKPPITKTNVLKMDNNFKGAVALYEYIISYTDAGYTVEEEVQEISSFSDSLAEDMAEAELLLSFLTYRYSLGLGDELKLAYESDEATRRQEELRQKTEQMESIRRRLAKEGKPQEEYLLYLEKHVRALQNEADRLAPLYKELDVYKETEHRLQLELTHLEKRTRQLEEELEQLRKVHAEELKALADAHLAEVSDLIQTHRTELDAMTERCNTELAELTERYTAQIAALQEGHDVQVASLREELDAARADIARLTNENQALADEKKVLDARVLALRSKRGEIGADEKNAMTEKERFDELEDQLEAFVRFYKNEWSLTKRKIRKDLLNLKYIKGQSGKE